jgi:hypothetical protein
VIDSQNPRVAPKTLGKVVESLASLPVANVAGTASSVGVLRFNPGALVDVASLLYPPLPVASFSLAPIGNCSELTTMLKFYDSSVLQDLS